MAEAILGNPAGSDRGFFRACVSTMALVLVMGFVIQLALGRSSFNAPLIVHAHAVVFMGWVGIVLTQAWLATGGNMAWHRSVGRLAVVWTSALLVFGTLVTVATVQTGRTPFFFQPQHFLIANPMTLLGFLGLFGAAMVLRHWAGWHARLQIGAFVMLMGPGFGRLIPMPFLTPYAFEIACMVALVFPAIGILRDWREHRRPHPAWFWSVGVLIGTLLLARVMGFSPIGEAIYAWVTAGTALAETDGLAFPPPPPGPN